MCRYDDDDDENLKIYSDFFFRDVHKNASEDFSTGLGLYGYEFKLIIIYYHQRMN